MKRNLIKKLSGGFAIGFMAIGLFSCSSEGVNGPVDPNEQTASFQISFTVPGTRATETEEGTAAESELVAGKINLFFTDANNNIIHSFPASDVTAEKVANSNKDYTLSVNVNLSEFKSIVAGKTLKALLVVNSDKSTITNVANEGIPYPTILSYGTAGANVPMSNAALSGQITFGSADDIDKDLKDNDYTLNLSTKGLGTITLERAVARLDYKDGSQKGNNIFPIGNSGLYGQVVEIMPVNVHNTSYLFGHTASTGGGTASLFGNGEWVADIDWAAKTGALNTGILANTFNNATGAGGDLSSYSWTKVSDLTAVDNLNQDYHPWVYVAENTLPGTDAMIEGLSTGVAFKVKLCKDDAGNAWTSSDAQPAGASIDATAKSVTMGSTTSKLDSDANGFYLTYFYWIRHKDNSKPHEMGDMEFAVVRNTVYKLSITALNSLPRAYNPTDPDEPPVVALNVEVKVLPWGYYRIIEEM